MKKQLLALTACSLVLAGCSNSDTPKTTEAAPTTSHSIPVPKTSVENKTPLADTDVGFLGLQAPEGAVDIHRHSFNEYDPSVIEAFPHLRQYEPEIHRWMGNYPHVTYEQILEKVRTTLGEDRAFGEINGMKYAEITSIPNPLLLQTEDGQQMKEHQLCWEEQIGEGAYRSLTIFIREFQYPEMPISGVEYYYATPFGSDCNTLAKTDIDALSQGG